MEWALATCKQATPRLILEFVTYPFQENTPRQRLDRLLHFHLAHLLIPTNGDVELTENEEGDDSAPGSVVVYIYQS